MNHAFVMIYLVVMHLRTCFAFVLIYLEMFRESSKKHKKIREIIFLIDKLTDILEIYGF